MSKEVGRFVLGGVAIGAGFLLAGPVGAKIAAKGAGALLLRFGASAAVNIGAGLIQSAFTPGPDAPSYAALDVSRLDPLAAFPVIYGRRRVGLTLVFRGVQPSDNRYLWLVGVLCHGSRDGGGIHSLDELYFDGRLAWTAAGGVQAPFTGKVAVYTRSGSTTQTAIPELTAAFPGTFGPQDRGLGLAWVALRLERDPQVFPGPYPDVQAVVRGARVEDPRDGQWKYSTNPALCTRDYLLSPVYGYGPAEAGWEGVLPADLDDAGWSAEANYCDDPVTSPLGLQPRFACNALLDTAQFREDNLLALLTSWRAAIIEERGLFRPWVRRATVPLDWTLTEADLVAEDDVVIQRPGVRERANQAVISFVLPEDNWQAAERQWPPLGAANPYRVADGNNLFERQLSLPFTASAYTAEQIAMVEVKESRAALLVQVPVQERAMRVRVGSLLPVSYAPAGWAGKLFWVVGIEFRPMSCTGVLTLLEYWAGAYDLEVQMLFTPPAASPLPNPFTTLPPSSVSVVALDVDAAATPGLARLPRLRVQWAASADPFLARYEVEVRKAPDGAWLPLRPVFAPGTEVVSEPMDAASGWEARVRAVNSLGIVSAWVTASTTTGAPLVPATQARVAIGTLTATDHEIAVTYSFPADSTATKVRVYCEERSTDPGTTPPSVAGTGWAPLGPFGAPLLPGDGRTVLKIPVARAGNWIVATFVPEDANNRAGVVQTLVVRATGGGSGGVAPTPPAALAAIESVASGPDTRTLRVQLPPSNLPTTIRLLRDGVPVLEVPVTVLGNQWQTLPALTGLTPTQTYLWQGNGVGNGVETAGPSVSLTQPSGALPTPSIAPGTYDVGRSRQSFTVAAGAGAPGGVTYETQVRPNPGGVPGASAAGPSGLGPTLFEGIARTVNPQARQIRVRTLLTGWTTSAWSAWVDYEIPGTAL